VDGVVVEGRSTVDESMRTGEQMPSEKQGGDTVTGGTINGTGSFLLRAEHVGSETVLARIVQMVAEAQRSRAPIQALAGKLAGFFVPAVLGIAVLTFVVWLFLGPEPRLAHAIVNSVAVLIIACPCALGLATPMSVMVGVGRGAQAGVLVKSAESLERLENVTIIVVDKTGTLTEGRPGVVEVRPVEGVEESELLRFAASVERTSEHPVGAAIVEAAKTRGVALSEAKDFTSTTGGGVSASVDGHAIHVGKLDYLKQHSVQNADALSDAAAKLQELGQTAIFVGVDGRAAGFITVADPLKPPTP